MSPATAANVLILGCGRSGTSIFGELFEAFDGYRYWSEPTLSEVRSPADGAAIAVKVPRVDPADDAPAGLPRSLQAMWKAVPEPRVVFWQIRHPLDAICSLRVGIGDGWGHHPRPPDWQHWQHRSLVERCAHHWATINGPGYEAVAEIAVVRHFEDMIADPRWCADDTARRVGASAETPPVAAWVDRVQDTNNERFIEAQTSRRLSRLDHRHRVGRWRENLTAADVDLVWPLVAEAAASFGYSGPDTRS